MSARSSRFQLVSEQRPEAPPVGPKAARGASIGYSLAFVTLLGSGALALAGRAPLADYVDDVKMPANGQTTCLRSSRHADYASVWLPVGTPTRNAELLIRLDQTVATAAEALTLRSKVLSQSQTISCLNSSLCSDIIHLETDGPGSPAVRHVHDGFLYTSSVSDWSLLGGTIGLDGEVKLVRGADYWLTTTHFCWAAASHSQIPNTFNDRRSVYTAYTDASGNNKVNAASQLTPEECRGLGMETSLFPYMASHEMTWLSMASRYVYEHAVEALQRRRLSVSFGQVCAESQHTNGELDSSVWIDCQHGVCQQTPSVSYRALLAQSNLFMRLPGASTTSTC